MNLHYQSLGAGKPLIIIHGLFGSADNWRSHAKYFAKTHHVITVDLRNHGRSPHSDENNFEVMAEDILTLMNTLALDKVTLLGHSLGGKVAMTFAEQYADRLEKLIVVDISPRAYQGEHTPLMDAMMAIDMAAMHSRSEVDTALAQTISDKAVRQFLLMNVVPQEQGMAWRINLPALKANYKAYMAAVCENISCSLPTLFIYGEHSDYVSDDDKLQISDIFPNVSFAAVAAGHWVHAERPQQFKQIVEEFLSDD